MNAFEAIVKLYLEEQGYWVRQSAKVHISKEDKKAIGIPSMPTPEVDLVALNVKENELILVEAKSFLDSPGVNFESISGNDPRQAKRFKLFTNDKFREVVMKRLQEEYLKQGLIRQDTKVTLGLAAGHIRSKDDQDKIAEYFKEKGWRLFTPKQIKETVRKLSQRGWVDDLIVMTAKVVEK